MIFNTDKCKVVHFGYNNTAVDYSLSDLNIQSVKETANSANRTLGMINRTFVNKHSNIMLKLYQSLVRPKLEYCIQAAIFKKGY